MANGQRSSMGFQQQRGSGSDLYPEYADTRQQYGNPQQNNPYYTPQQASPYSNSRQFANQSPYAQAQAIDSIKAAPRNAAGVKKGDKGSSNVGLTVLVGLICLILGAGGMFLAMNLLNKGTITVVSTTLKSSQLDTAVGSYVFNGQTFEVTARDVLLDSHSLESVQKSDGSYPIPTADDILAYVRNQILNKLVASAGITVSDYEVGKYAISIIGIDDYAAIGSYYGISSEQAKRLMSESAAVAKLKQQVESGSLGSTVQPPSAPGSTGNEVATLAYAKYIIGLLGNNWDSTRQSWANTDNDYYRALSGMVFSGDSANYEAAMAAYSIALKASGVSSQASSWIEYVNKYMALGAISIYTLVS